MPTARTRLFRDAIDALLRWQLASKPGVLPPYDRALLTRELELFPDWYVGRHRALTLDAAQSAALDSGIQADPRKQSGATGGLRASRLHAAQPDGR